MYVSIRTSDTMRLVRTRECDGQCCKEHPRFPTDDGKDCVYLKDRRCTLWNNPSLIPDGDCPVWREHTAVDAFILSCKQWPHNAKPDKGGTQGCCWQWVD